MTDLLEGKRILITGGTGSLGQVLTRRILSGRHGKVRKVIVLSRDEAKQHAMRLSYLHRRSTTDETTDQDLARALEFRIGDVRDYADVCAAVRDADVVVNAAALKQVPTCEYFPEQALLTNCTGPTNIVRAIREHGLPVQTVVGVSTDKACKPVSVMGMTKALQERILIAGNLLVPGTRFVCVRQGNALASRGSVIPLFREQIRIGGPVTVTVPEMTRYLSTLEDAVDVVLEAVRSARAGETLVPSAPAARVIDIARALVGERKVEIRVDGIRPGERMHEVLVSEEECHRTWRRGAAYAIRPMLPELAGAAPDEGPPVGRELRSVDALVSEPELVALLRRNELLVEQVADNDGPELLR